MIEKVYVVTAWNQKTGVDVCLVFAKKEDADAAWEKFETSPAAKHIYGCVYERKVRQ